MLFKVSPIGFGHHHHSRHILNFIRPEEPTHDLSGETGDDARHSVELSPQRGRIDLIPSERVIAPALWQPTVLPACQLQPGDFTSETQEMIAHRVSAFMDSDSPDGAFEFAPSSWR